MSASLESSVPTKRVSKRLAEKAARDETASKNAKTAATATSVKSSAKSAKSAKSQATSVTSAAAVASGSCSSDAGANELLEQVSTIYKSFQRACYNRVPADAELEFKMSLSLVSATKRIDPERGWSHLLIIQRNDGVPFDDEFLQSFHPHYVAIFNQVVDAANSWYEAIFDKPAPEAEDEDEEHAENVLCLQPLRLLSVADIPKAEDTQGNGKGLKGKRAKGGATEQPIIGAIGVNQLDGSLWGSECRWHFEWQSDSVVSARIEELRENLEDNYRDDTIGLLENYTRLKKIK